MPDKHQDTTPGRIDDPAPAQGHADVTSPASRPEGQTAASRAETPDESVVETAKQEAAARASDRKNDAADRADDQADRLKEAGESFETDSFAQQAAHGLADNLHQAAEVIRGSDLGVVVDDVATFARRQPVMFFGGAALLGFVAARMMKASERSDPSTRM